MLIYYFIISYIVVYCSKYLYLLLFILFLSDVFCFNTYCHTCIVLQPICVTLFMKNYRGVVENQFHYLHADAYFFRDHIFLQKAPLQRSMKKVGISF